MNEPDRRSRFTDPTTAIDHVRTIARTTAQASGYQAAARALNELYVEYRVMPLRRAETPPDQVTTWEAVRLETRSLAPMAMGAHGGIKDDIAAFTARVATPADQPLPPQPGWAPDPVLTLQAAALRGQPTSRPAPVPSSGPAVDRTPGR